MRQRSTQEVVKEDSQLSEDWQSQLRTRLAARVGKQRFDLWFGPHTKLSVNRSGLIIRTASTFLRDWLQQNFSHDIRVCCVEVLGSELPLEFEIDASLLLHQPSMQEPSTRKPLKQQNPAKPDVPSVPEDLTKTEPPAGQIRSREMSLFRPTRTDAKNATAKNCFASFVSGASNEYALRSAQMTAQGVQQASPVLFCGPTGIGKTHLLRAIRNEHRRHHPHGRAVYLTAEQFTTSFIEALRGSGLPSFRQKCRGADVLILDDIHFFASKRATLEEVLHTVDAQMAEGRQIVFASDRSLAELHSLGKELVSRMSGGLVCTIKPPEFKTRLGILHRLCVDLHMKVEEGVLSMIASRVTTDPRELRGALHRLEATSLALNQPISKKLADSELTEIVRQSTRSVRLPDVQKAVCDVFGVEPSSLRSERKTRAISEPRTLAMWLARKHTQAPWSEIGQFFGRRSHSTVISAHHRVEKLIRQQAEIGVSDRPCSVEEAIRRVEAALRTA